jgi:multidrug efflux pump subunit AcrA (membrane-fusion protein)
LRVRYIEELEKIIVTKQNHFAAIRRQWLIVLLVICLAAFGMWAFFHKPVKAVRKEANHPPFGVPVVAVTAKKGDFPVYLRGIGTVTPAPLPQSIQ